MYRSIFFKQYLSSKNFAEVESEEIFDNPIEKACYLELTKGLDINFL